MPIWVIELFGREELNRAFLAVFFLTAPAWIAMIVFPSRTIVQRLARPLVLPPLLTLCLLALVWQFHAAAMLPATPEGLDYGAARAFVRHPSAFLVLFCNLQLLNLLCGTYMYQTAKRHAMRVPVELLLCWFLGAPALLVFAGHLLFKGKDLR